MQIHPTTLLRTKYSDIDGLIKFVEAIIFGGIVFLIAKPMSFFLLSVYLLIVTFISRINTRMLLKSLISYCFVFLFPYLFGIGMNTLLYAVFKNDIFSFQQDYVEIFLRLYQLLMIWYLSILYFYTTDMKTMLGLFDKLLTPLKFLGVPISDYIKIVMCVMQELAEIGSDVKKIYRESLRPLVTKDKWKYNINIKGISQIIVSLIVNSFDKLDKIERSVEKIDAEEVCEYKFKLSIIDVVSSLIFFVLVSLIVMIENC